jgi:anti-sigma regulatory factor (Ser/Thr protein kinase)
LVRPEIALQARLERLPELQHWVETLATEYLLPASTVHRIDLCLTELMTNLISYGYPDGKHGTVRFRFWRQPDQIVIRINDDGAAFDPTRFVSQGPARSLEEASAGGRGILLVRHFSDELHHIRAGAENQLTLVFRSRETRPERSAPPADSDTLSPKPTGQPL